MPSWAAPSPRLWRGPSPSFPWGFAPLAFSACACYSALAFAAYFRFGYLASRWVTMILMGIIGALLGAFATVGKQGSIVASQLPGLASSGIAVGASLLALGLSFLYARRRFAKKEL